MAEPVYYNAGDVASFSIQQQVCTLGFSSFIRHCSQQQWKGQIILLQNPRLTEFSIVLSIVIQWQYERNLIKHFC